AQRRELLQDRPRLNRIQATSTRAVRGRLRYTDRLRWPRWRNGLTFHLDRSAGLIKALSPMGHRTKRSCAFEAGLNATANLEVVCRKAPKLWFSPLFLPDSSQLRASPQVHSRSSC